MRWPWRRKPRGYRQTFAIVDEEYILPDERVIDMSEQLGPGTVLFKNRRTGKSELRLGGGVTLLDPDRSTFHTLLQKLARDPQTESHKVDPDFMAAWPVGTWVTAENGLLYGRISAYRPNTSPDDWLSEPTYYTATVEMPWRDPPRKVDWLNDELFPRLAAS